MDEEYEGWTFAQKAAFNCCIDYLVMLIEKYGKEVLDEILTTWRNFRVQNDLFVFAFSSVRLFSPKFFCYEVFRFHMGVILSQICVQKLCKTLS